MKNTFSILFYLKKSKVNYNNEAPIYLRITVDGKRAEYSIKRRIDIKKWNISANKGIGRNEKIRVLNEYINMITSKVYKIHKDLIEDSNEISATSIKNILTGSTTKTKSIIEIFEYHNKQLKVLEGKQYASATVKRYDTALKHVKRFINYNFNVNDVSIIKVDHKFITDFEFYLKSKRNCSHNTTLKYIKNFKKIVRVALANNWIGKDPFINYKVSFNKVDRGYLTEKELQKIIDKKFNIPRLDQVKNVFLFACYTGLSYSDLAKLSENNIVTKLDGKKWIYITRTKTGIISKIPLLPKAIEILNKYKNNPICVNKQVLLPVLSNQKYNGYLKEISDLSNINKLITSHLARNTFATTITLSKGISIESVSAMLGHSNIKTTQIYAKITDSKVGVEMNRLMEAEDVSTDESIEAV